MKRAAEACFDRTLSRVSSTPATAGDGEPRSWAYDWRMDVVRHRANLGWIEVIVGSMFSGKSEELIRRLRRAQIARQRVQIFKPAVDTRFGGDHIVSHSDMRIASTTVASAEALLAATVAGTEVVGIDEGQFFDAALPHVCNQLAGRGIRVIVAGLDQDYLGRPFEPMPQLLAIAEYITKTLAICVVCGNPANHTQRLVASGDRVLVGAQGMYEARCRTCFRPVEELSASSVAGDSGPAGQ
jgi:thymidine kinase